VGIQGTAYFQNPIHIGWVVGGKNYLEATIFPIDDPTWFRGMIQSTTEPIGQPLVMGSGAMLVIYIYVIYIYIYVMYIYIYYLVGGLERDFFSIHLGMSSSQLTHIFQRGRYTTNQVYVYIYTPL